MEQLSGWYEHQMALLLSYSLTDPCLWPTLLVDLINPPQTNQSGAHLTQVSHISLPLAVCEWFDLNNDNILGISGLRPLGNWEPRPRYVLY